MFQTLSLNTPSHYHKAALDAEHLGLIGLASANWQLAALATQGINRKVNMKRKHTARVFSFETGREVTR
jgi:hypothetical protein